MRRDEKFHAEKWERFYRTANKVYGTGIYSVLRESMSKEEYEEYMNKIFGQLPDLSDSTSMSEEEYGDFVDKVLGVSNQE